MPEFDNFETLQSWLSTHLETTGGDTVSVTEFVAKLKPEDYQVRMAPPGAAGTRIHKFIIRAEELGLFRTLVVAIPVVVGAIAAAASHDPAAVAGVATAAATAAVAIATVGRSAYRDGVIMSDSETLLMVLLETQLASNRLRETHERKPITRGTLGEAAIRLDGSPRPFADQGAVDRVVDRLKQYPTRVGPKAFIQEDAAGEINLLDP